jgi:formylglycine-generating enzyme required for sulfatase activity
MTDKPRSRHIPKEEVTDLLEESRSRCCLCRVFIDPAQYDPDALFDSLEKHHIIMFSLGGLHSHENLLLACANCHTQIHQAPEKFPMDKLREKKQHWVGMRDVVPSELVLPGEGEGSIQVTFSVDGLNLQYTITAPPQATVADLALFVGESILKPLDEYDGYKPLPPGEIGLALRSDTEAILDPALHLGEIELAPGDALVANVPARRIRVIPPPIFDRRGEGEPEMQEPAAEPRLREVTPEPKQPVWERRHPFEPEMVFVPAGSFWMGSDSSDAPSYESPQHRVTLPAYWIGKYPVTNTEYRAFIEGGGYQTRRHWTEAGWQWKGDRTHPSCWNDKRDNSPQQPVVGVSWYEALAYCRWLSQLTGRHYMLPSEAQWEKAARGTDGRVWPWGNEWEPGKCNTIESLIYATTPVDQYSPQGDSAYGCADMAGSARNWCATKWESSYENYRGDNDPEGSTARVLRGGSWADGPNRARCSYRALSSPEGSRASIGFRCVSPVSGSDS